LGIDPMIEKIWSLPIFFRALLRKFGHQFLVAFNCQLWRSNFLQSLMLVTKFVEQCPKKFR
jgi:hypothetical protein